MQHEVTPKQLRSFGLLVGGIFALIGLWPLIWRGEGLRLWAMIATAILLLPAVVYPMSLKLIYRGWMAAGEVLGWINTRIILSIIFYGVFTPVAVVMRMRGKDPMRRGWDPNLESYREVREPRPGSHMQHQF
jgi:Saxitoxin biosynthesis operon protein SxtJ